MPQTYETAEAPRTPNRKRTPIRPPWCQKRGRKAEREAKKIKREKPFFLSQASTLPHAVLVTMVGNSKKKKPWMWTKGYSSLAPSQVGVGFKGEKPIAAGGASESKRWIKNIRSLFLSSLSPFSSSLCLSCPLSEVAQTLPIRKGLKYAVASSLALI